MLDIIRKALLTYISYIISDFSFNEAENDSVDNWWL